MTLESTLIDQTRYFAQKAHESQMYGDKTHMDHVEDVFDILSALEPIIVLSELGDSAVCDILCAALCHDILEDTSHSYNDLVRIIGERAADTVYDVTNELGKNRKERSLRTYPKIARNPLAIIVKLADRIANVRYSKKSGSPMFKKYQQEQYDFESFLDRRGLGIATPIERKLWELLELAIQG